jgi:hypothetical protein
MYSHMTKEKMMGLVVALLIEKENGNIFFTKQRCKRQKNLSPETLETFAEPTKSSFMFSM